MNGAVYISFFQGQLESVLEQVVQLAVQEISKTVGSSLNGLLLETAVKEQENRRLQLQIQARESDHQGGQAKSKAAEERAEGGHGRQQHHGPGHSSDRGFSGDSRRLEQRTVKSVMQRVLEFAVSELTKIVEASFDDLLLEITKMEKEQQSLEERLGLGRSENSENDSMSPSGSEENGDKENHHLQRGAVASDLAAPQDWVPILDKVFGQKWCGDMWSAERQEGGVSTETGGSGRGSAAAPPLRYVTPLRSAARRSSASMLHRLLTLPSQLLEEEDVDDGEMEAIAISMATEAAAMAAGATETDRSLTLPTATRDEEDEEEEEEEEDDRRKRKRRRVWSECEDCGRRFSRVSLLKATARRTSPTRLPCGKRFSSSTRLQSHVQTSHAEKQA
uniref:C2H2-type domain-containing protein n=1 Tax=Neogobius melanostomus TaxID=47308 RepID=A0A8C6TCY8_9GOBI